MLKLVLTCFLLISHYAMAQPIQGSVTTWANNDYQPVVGQKVILKIFNAKKQIAASQAQTDPEGTYTFDIENQKDWFYQVSVPFDNTFFDSKFFAYPTRIVENITIAPTTGSIDDIQTTEVVFLEFGGTDLVKVTHQVELINTGKKAYHYGKTDAQPLALKLIEGGFNPSLIDGITRQEVRLDGETHTMFLDIMLPPGATKSFRFSYMYPLDHRGILFVRPNTQGYQSIHIISNKDQIKLAKDDATEIAIPESLGTKFSKAFELNLNKPSIHVKIGGVIPIKYQMRLWTLYFSLLLAVALLLYFFIKPSKQEEVTAEILQEKIKTLKASTNPSAKTLHQIDLLQRQLYHILYD